MRQIPLFAAALTLSCGSLRAGSSHLVDSAARPFALDTCGSPRTIASAAALSSLPPLVYLAGETITISSPAGIATTPITSAANKGTHAWAPSAPGVWSLANDGEGMASFLVYGSLFLSGAGTSENPAVAVDATDFATMMANVADKDGFVFATGEGVSADDFARPAGYALVSAGEGVWRLVPAAGGLLCSSATQFPIDTRRPGPDRTVGEAADVLPCAYSGDGWTWTNAVAESTLTVASPTGVETSEHLAGTGASQISSVIDAQGIWTVTLASPIETLVAKINYQSGTIILMR